MARLQAGNTLVVASHNPGKVWEIGKLVSPYGLKVVSAGDLGLIEPEETAMTFSGNARLKAELAARASGYPALADDSGLEVACLGGAPGIYSARWAGPTKDFGLAMKKVAEEVTQRHGWAHPGPRANFICVLALAWPDGHVDEFTGQLDGTLVWPPRGANGFGYDAMFMADGETVTLGEMDPDRKNAISHRAHAFAQFKQACLGESVSAPPFDPTGSEALNAASAAVSTREEFVAFIAGLKRDIESRCDAHTAAHVISYVDAIGAWATHATIPPEPVWRTLAKAMRAAQPTR